MSGQFSKIKFHLRQDYKSGAEVKLLTENLSDSLFKVSYKADYFLSPK